MSNTYNSIIFFSNIIYKVFMYNIIEKYEFFSNTPHILHVHNRQKVQKVHSILEKIEYFLEEIIMTSL